MDEIKSIEYEDVKTTVVYLRPGDYLINDEPFRVDGYNWQEKKIEVKNLKSVRKIETTRILQEYQDKDGNVLQINDYNKQFEELESKGNIDYDDCLLFNDLDDEYNYKKFKQKWSPIYKTVQTISEPLKLSKKILKLDTGNPYIKTAFGSIKNSDLEVYQYFQRDARINLLKNKMSELGMEFVEKANYGATEGKKIYSISHSGIRYAVAFGTYIFSDGEEGRYIITDTYDNCKKMYENDKKWMNNKIQKLYNKHFYKGNLGNISVDELLKKLNLAKNNFKKVSPYKKTMYEYNTGNKFLKSAIELLEESYKE